MGDPLNKDSHELWSIQDYETFLSRNFKFYWKSRSLQERLRTKIAYGKGLPIYVTSRCPICNQCRSEPIDTFSLNGFGWGSGNYGVGWSSDLGLPSSMVASCQHLRIVHFFLNLESLVPTELSKEKRIKLGPEVPCVMPVPMTAPGAVAVIHRIPVGQYGEVPRQPRYSVYFVTYYSESQESFDAAIKDWQPQHGLVDYQDVDYNLNSWVGQKNLLWLSPEDPELPLVSIDGGDFPYGNIQGDRDPQRIITAKGGRKPKTGLFGRMREWVS